MTITNVYVIFALLILLLIGILLFLGQRYKKSKRLSSLAALAFAFIVAGLFFGNHPILGFSLFAAGIILALCDIIIKARESRQAEALRRQNASRLRCWTFMAIAGGLCAWMMAAVSWAQVFEQKTWPQADSGQWHWTDPNADRTPEQVQAAFQQAVDENMALLDPEFSSTIFLVNDIRLVKGKTKARSQYGDQPEKADVLRIETEWRTGDMNQYRGASYCSISMDSIRSMDLNYLHERSGRFAKVPDGSNWNIRLHAGLPYNFFLRTEDAARSFINALTSALRQRGLSIPFSRFGLMWENVTPAQAADMGRPVGEGVLVSRVAVAGPAGRAGIRPLDMVLQVNGVMVKNFSHFTLLLQALAPGSKASLLMLRRIKDPVRAPEQNEWNTLTLEMEAPAVQ